MARNTSILFHPLSTSIYLCKYFASRWICWRKNCFSLGEVLINSVISSFLLYSFFDTLEYINSNEFYSPRFFFLYNIFFFETEYFIKFVQIYLTLRKIWKFRIQCRLFYKNSNLQIIHPHKHCHEIVSFLESFSPPYPPSKISI